MYLFAEQAHAVPASPVEIELKQPSGDVVRAHRFGDEWYNGVETTNGFTIIKNRQSREWEYAEKGTAGRLQPSGVVVGEDEPSGRKHLRDTNEVLAAEATRMEASALESQPTVGLSFMEDPSRSLSIGSDRSLVILAKFNDQESLGSTPDHWNDRYFGADDSVKHYYEEVSYGQFSVEPAGEAHGVENDGVVGWVTLDMNHPNTTEAGVDTLTATRAAIVAADPWVNYASFDTDGDGHLSTSELHINVVFAGQDASCCTNSSAKHVWPHYWSLASTVGPAVVDGKSAGDHGFVLLAEMQGNHQTTLGMPVHEMGHLLGLPDLYDVDPLEAKSSDGVGLWSVMGTGMWLQTPSDSHPGETPSHPDAWSKWFKGWINPQVVSEPTNRVVNAAASSTNAEVAVQMLENPAGPGDWTRSGDGSGEYFLVENRQPIPGTYDESLPGGGLLVLHVNEAMRNNATDTNRLVDVEEADNLGELDVYGGDHGDAGDLYPGSSSNSSFTGISTPNSNLNDGAPSGVGITNISDSSMSMTADFLDAVAARPPNDDSANATRVGNGFSASVDNTYATMEGGEAHQEGCSAIGRTVWFTYTPVRDERITADTQNGDIATAFDVWSGNSLHELQPEGCSATVGPTSGETWSQVEDFLALRGETYYFRVGGIVTGDGAAAGTIVFNTRVRPANDHYRHARIISGSEGTAITENDHATKEPGEPNHAGDVGGASIWYRWTAPSSETFTFHTRTSSVYDTLLAVYTGEDFSGPAVAQNDNVSMGDTRSQVEFFATEGTTYSIAVDVRIPPEPELSYLNFGLVDLTWRPTSKPAEASLWLQTLATRDGDRLEYWILINNGGPDTAENVVLTDVLPPEVSLVSAQGGNCSGTSTVVCNLGDLVKDRYTSVTIVTEIERPGEITNTASVSSSADDPGVPNYADVVTVTVDPPVADLRLQKDVVRNGDRLTYAITVSNEGPDTAKDVTVTDQLPAEVSLVSHGAGCSGTSTVTCDLGDLADGAQATITMTADILRPGQITNTASVSSAADDPDGSNNTDVASVTVDPPTVDRAAQTDVSISGDVIDGGYPGGFVYEFTVERSGAAGNTSVTAMIELPQDVRYDAIDSPDNCSVNGYISCNFGLLAVGSPETVEIRVTPKTPGPHTAIGTVIVVDATPDNDRASATATTRFICDNEATSGNDVITGTSGDDILCGFGGDDTIEGMSGDDLIFGGAGIDTVTYKKSRHAVVVNLNSQSIEATGAWPREKDASAHGRDRFTGIERAQGSMQADLLVGSIFRADKIWGLGGRDRIYGHGGKDALFGDGGADVLKGGKDRDFLHGGGGPDECSQFSDNRRSCEA